MKLEFEYMVIMIQEEMEGYDHAVLKDWIVISLAIELILIYLVWHKEELDWRGKAIADLQATSAFALSSPQMCMESFPTFPLESVGIEFVEN